MTPAATFIGMDLGTFKTSVASSAGLRDVIPTAVGWPKDHIARTMLGRDVVFGKDVHDHRMALEVVRPFEKGLLKYLDGKAAGMTEGQSEKHMLATRLVVEYAVMLMQPPKDKPVYGVIGVPARASVKNKKFILEAVKGVFDAVAVVSEPFTIAYGMNRLTDALVVDIGAGTIDLCPMYGVYPQESEQITLPFGGDFVDEEFEKAVRAKYPEAQVTRNMLREIKEKYGFVHDVNEECIVPLPVDGKPRPFDLTVPLKSACSAIAGPIVDAVQEMVRRFDPEFQVRMRQNIVLGGGGSQLKGLDRVIENGMKEYGGGRVTRVTDATYAGAVGALKLAMSMPADGWTRLKDRSAPTAHAASTAAVAA